MPDGVVAFTRLIDLDRSELQPFLEDLVGGVGPETHPRATDIDPVRPVRREGHQLAVMKTRGIDHDVVQMLTADLGMVHDHRITRLEAVETVALDPVEHRSPQIGQEDGQPALVLADHPPFGVDQPAAIIAHLVDHHVVGGLAQRRRHVFRIGDQRVAHHFKRHGVNVHILRPRRQWQYRGGRGR